MLRNAVGVAVCQISAKKALRRYYDSTLLALRGGWVGVEFPEKKGLRNT